MKAEQDERRHPMIARFSFALLLLSSVGCAPVMQSATFADGGSAESQWVFINTDASDVDGVYHCTAAAGRVVCTRAELTR